MAMVSGPPIRVLPPHPTVEAEDKEIVETVVRLDLEKEFNAAEFGALLHVLQVNARFWPSDINPKDFLEAEEFGKKHHWHWSTEDRKKLMEDKTEDLLLMRAQAIPWAQTFVLNYTSKNLEGYMKDNGNGRYPTYMQSFSSQLDHTRSEFVKFHNPTDLPPFEPIQEKNGGGLGGSGFLIGAVLILLLALGLLLYFLLR